MKKILLVVLCLAFSTLHAMYSERYYRCIPDLEQAKRCHSNFDASMNRRSEHIFTLEEIRSQLKKKSTKLNLANLLLDEPVNLCTESKDKLKQERRYLKHEINILRRGLHVIEESRKERESRILENETRNNLNSLLKLKELSEDKNELNGKFAKLKETISPLTDGKIKNSTLSVLAVEC